MCSVSSFMTHFEGVVRGLLVFREPQLSENDGGVVRKSSSGSSSPKGFVVLGYLLLEN